MSTIAEIAKTARRSSLALAKRSGADRSAALSNIAEAMLRRQPEILDANRADVEAARSTIKESLLDRLRLDEKRLYAAADAVRSIAAMNDPIGEVVKSWTRPNRLRIERQRIPLGVIAIIYESRPHVTTDAAALCLRAGNATILRGGSEAFRTNQALGQAITDGLGKSALPTKCVQLLPTTDRQALGELLKCEEDIDLVIPRGGEALIRFVGAESRIPVIKHYRGNCHIFVERTADVHAALEVCYNAKVQRPGVCNAVETILIDEAIANSFLPALAKKFAGVELRGDGRACAIVPTIKPASDEDFAAEFLDLICAVGIVDNFDAAVAHIERFGSSHSEAILTRDENLARRFVNEVNSSTVLVNASTRFADGGELGLGAEIGVSTTRLHAYGPMGAEELTTTKFVVHGDGQIRT